MQLLQGDPKKNPALHADVELLRRTFCDAAVVWGYINQWPDKVEGIQRCFTFSPVIGGGYLAESSIAREAWDEKIFFSKKDMRRLCQRPRRWRERAALRMLRLRGYQPIEYTKTVTVETWNQGETGEGSLEFRVETVEQESLTLDHSRRGIRKTVHFGTEGYVDVVRARASLYDQDAFVQQLDETRGHGRIIINFHTGDIDLPRIESTKPAKKLTNQAALGLFANVLGEYKHFTGASS